MLVGRPSKQAWPNWTKFINGNLSPFPFDQCAFPQFCNLCGGEASKMQVNNSITHGGSSSLHPAVCRAAGPRNRPGKTGRWIIQQPENFSPTYRVCHDQCQKWHAPFLGHTLVQEAVLSRGDRALRQIWFFEKKNWKFYFSQGQLQAQPGFQAQPSLQPVQVHVDHGYWTFWLKNHVTW